MSVLHYLLSLSMLMHLSHGWMPTITSRSSSIKQRIILDPCITTLHRNRLTLSAFNSNNNDNSNNINENNGEPDLFEYFDPLLSPHAYPNGISPDNGMMGYNNNNNNNFPNDNSNMSGRSNTMDPFTPFNARPQSNDFDNNNDNQNNNINPQSNNNFPRNSNNNNDPDLFDYFDPRNSPHDYPNGIDAAAAAGAAAAAAAGAAAAASGGSMNHDDNTMPKSTNNDYPPYNNMQEQPPLFNMNSPLPERSPAKFRLRDDENDNEFARFQQPPPPINQDLFDYFDPRISPHDYPNGIDAAAAAATTTTTTNTPPFTTSSSSSSNSGTFSTGGTAGSTFNTGSTSGPFNTVGSNNFDTSSFSSFFNSTTATTNNNDKKKNTLQKTVGVLLIDHGSRNPDSNQRLLDLANLYQSSCSDGKNNNVIVQAAHMEIAKPSIQDGLQLLINQNVDEIICHPYFLSPGRHVQEDIPDLIAKAAKDLQITNIPLITTDPVGSNTLLMISAIDAMVRQQSKILK